MSALPWCAVPLFQKLPELEDVEEFSRKELGAELQRAQQLVEENRTLRCYCMAGRWSQHSARTPGTAHQLLHYNARHFLHVLQCLETLAI